VKKKRIIHLFATGVVGLILGILIGYFSFIPVQRTLHNIKRSRENTSMMSWKNEPLPDGHMFNVDGKQWETSVERRKVRVLVFWSVSCGSCMEALDELNVVYESYAHMTDFAMTGIHRQREMDLTQYVCSQKGVKWPQFYETDSDTEKLLSSKLGIRRIPSIWVVGHEGTILNVQVPVESLQNILDQLLIK